MPVLRFTRKYNVVDKDVLNRLDSRVGNYQNGEMVFLSGTEVPIETQDPLIQWNAHETITVGATAVGLTAGLRKQADFALLYLELATARWWLDGTNPTATVGMPMNVADIIRLTSYWELDQFRIIAQTSVSASLNVLYGQRRLDANGPAA